MLVGYMCSIDTNCIFNNPYKNNVDMKAPEKIWIDPATDLPKLSGHIDKDGVEYTCTDAFMKKTCDWLDDLVLSDYVDIKETSNGTFVTFDQDKLVKDFRKYMKGE